MRSILDGYWEEGYHYYLEINGSRAVLRDYAKRVIFKTSLRYDKAAAASGKPTALYLGETVLSRTAAGEPMTWIKELRFEDGRIVMEYAYPIIGDKTYTLERVDHAPFDDIVIRDKEILPRVQGLWLAWSPDGIDEDEHGLRIKGNVLRYGSRQYDGFKVKIHAISRKNNPEQVLLTPKDLTTTTFPGLTQLTVEDDKLTGYPIVLDVSSPLLVFVRRENYDTVSIPPEALKEPRNLMKADRPPIVTDRPKPNITILSQTPPGVCGGTDATQDENAPKEIASDDMILFDAASVLNQPDRDSAPASPPLAYVAAFAAPAEKGTFLFLETREARRPHQEGKKAWALVEGPVFPALTALVREHDLAAQNGFQSTTHGLPYNFGGSIRVAYADGETICVSDNQSPVLRHTAGMAIAELFENAMQKGRMPLPDAGSLRSIRFHEQRDDGGFTRAVLTLNADGTGQNDKEQKFAGSEVHQSTKAVSAKTVAEIKRVIDTAGILAWVGLPKRSYSHGGQKTLTFVCDDGTEYTVFSDRVLPDPLTGAFFAIELELVTKN